MKIYGTYIIKGKPTFKSKATFTDFEITWIALQNIFTNCQCQSGIGNNFILKWISLFKILEEFVVPPCFKFIEK